MSPTRQAVSREKGRDGQGPSPIRLRVLLGKRRGLIALLVGVSFAAGVSEVGVLVLVAQAAAFVAGADRVHATVGPITLDAGLGQVIAAAFGFGVLRLMLQLGVAYLPARIAADAQATFRAGLFTAFNRASWAVQSQERDGHLQDLMTTQVNHATQGVLQATTMLGAAFSFLVLLASALVLSITVALAVLVTSGVLFLVLRPLAKLGRRHARGLSHAQIQHANSVGEAVNLAEETKAFGVANARSELMAAHIDAARDRFFQTQFLCRLVQGTYQSLVILLLVGALAGLYLSGTGRIATLGAVVLVLVRASTYGQQLQGAHQLLQQAAPHLERIVSAETRYRNGAEDSTGRRLPAIQRLSFSRVAYAYAPGSPVLRDVTFDVAAGEAIGIIGSSGAGKSTLVQLLLRLREPTEGRYLVNELPMNLASLGDWRRRVAYVPQEPRLVHGTVSENIRYLRDLDDATVERAAGLAHIHDDVTSWSDGYDTVIGQRADAISGGQRQRICIARALAGDPEVLVLDEPTSALDLHSEALIQESLVALHGRVTLFVVAHRLSALSICDRVIVLAEGQIEAIGTVSALAETNGFYRSAVSLAGKAQGRGQ